MIRKEHVRMFWWKPQLYRVELWRLYHILEDLLQFLPLICDLSGSRLILPVFAQVVILHQLRYIFFHHKKVSFIHESLKKRQWKTMIALSSGRRVVTLEHINGTNCTLTCLCFGVMYLLCSERVLVLRISCEKSSSYENHFPVICLLRKGYKQKLFNT